MVSIDRRIHPKPEDDRGTLPRLKSLLAIGRPDAWPRIRPLPGFDIRVTYTSFGDLDEVILRRIWPEMVLTPVVADSFDCLDVAQRLSYLGFFGQVRAVTSDPVHPRLIRREVHALCPALDFDILAPDGHGALTL